MRITIACDTDLLRQVCELGQFPTKEAAANAALSEYLNLLKRQQFLKLNGKIPNKATLASIHELEMGNVKKFDSVESLFKNLDD